MRALLIGAVVGFILSVSNALAWNEHGHYAVAEAAWRQLDEGTQKRVVELLKLNPDYEDWVQGEPEDQHGAVAFMKAAYWPDTIKGRPGYINDKVYGPDAHLNIGYADKNEHRYWHWKDLPFSRDGTKLKEPASPNAETQILVFRSAIGSANMTDDAKSYDLVWLIHLVGDVHQPLHATARFSKSRPKGDGGGNTTRICGDEDDFRCSLHAAWDGALGDDPSREAVLDAVDDLPQVTTAEIENTDVASWLRESFADAKKWAYRWPVKPDKGISTLTPAYKHRAYKVAQWRISLAGARLAKLLNENFK